MTILAVAHAADVGIHTEIQVQAALRLQRYIRSRNAMRSLRSITSKEAIAKLKAMFLDDRAIRAGAASNPLYATGVLAARNALRTDPQVVEALSQAWMAVNEAFGSPAGMPGLNHNQYCELSRKLYLACFIVDGSHLISPLDFSSNLETDWSSDTGGCKPREGMLGEEAFKRSWFELADVYTNAVDAAEYAEFLRGIIATISIVESDAPAEDRQQRGQTPMPTRSLTSDAQLLDLLKKRIPPERHREYRVRRQKWEEAFPADYAAWRWREPRPERNHLPSGPPDRGILRGHTRNWPRIGIEEYRRRSMLAAEQALQASLAGGKDQAVVSAPHGGFEDAPFPQDASAQPQGNLVGNANACSRSSSLRSSRLGSFDTISMPPSPIIIRPPPVSQNTSFSKGAQDHSVALHPLVRDPDVRQYRRALPRSALPNAPHAYSSIEAPRRAQSSAKAPAYFFDGALADIVASPSRLPWPPPSSGFLLTGDRPKIFNGDGGASLNLARSENQSRPGSARYTPAARRPSTAPALRSTRALGTRRQLVPQVIPGRALRSARLVRHQQGTRSSPVRSLRAQSARPRRSGEIPTIMRSNDRPSTAEPVQRTLLAHTNQDCPDSSATAKLPCGHLLAFRVPEGETHAGRCLICSFGTIRSKKGQSASLQRPGEARESDSSVVKIS